MFFRRICTYLLRRGGDNIFKIATQPNIQNSASAAKQFVIILTWTLYFYRLMSVSSALKQNSIRVRLSKNEIVLCLHAVST